MKVCRLVPHVRCDFLGLNITTLGLIRGSEFDFRARHEDAGQVSGEGEA